MFDCAGVHLLSLSRPHSNTWDAIESMWPSCSNNKHTGVSKDILRRIKYNDELNGIDRNESDTVVKEIASAETTLTSLVEEGARIKREFARSGAILTDHFN